ncbi:MAG: uroporphyrinogen decarboxylase family protein [Anaerolineae bacterium]|jgi:uroporphyrinogen decarboxylase
MAKMTSEERVMRVLRREEPDRVPHFEWLIDRKVREALSPGCKDTNDFAVRMGLDAVLADVKFQKERVGADRWRSEWGYVTQDTPEEHGIEVESPIKTMADFERFVPPDPLLPERYLGIEKMLDEFAGDKAVIVHLNDVFSLPRYLMGMENLLMSIVTQPELIEALVDLSVDVNIKMAKELAVRGVKMVYTGDDYAYTKGPLMSPKHFRQLFYPGLVRVMRGFKEAGMLIIKHTDGNLWPIIDMIIDSDIDCLDPIDPIAGMDIAEVKAKYGHRVALKGNVDCAQTLTFGTEEEVIEETKDAMRKGMPGGGFILSSGNSIHSAVKPENYMAMLRTWETYRDYPMSL